MHNLFLFFLLFSLHKSSRQGVIMKFSSMERRRVICFFHPSIRESYEKNSSTHIRVMWLLSNF
jgi:hypothetical protein